MNSPTNDNPQSPADNPQGSPAAAPPPNNETIDLVVRPAWLRVLNSAKVHMALASVVVAIGLRWGVQLEPELVMTVIAAFVAAILGIAWEDGQAKRATQVVELHPPPTAATSKAAATATPAGTRIPVQRPGPPE